MNNKYTLSDNFDPYYAVYALTSLSNLMFEYHAEGDGIYRTAPKGSHVTVLGAAWLSKRIANELDDYLAALSEAGINLPDHEDILDSIPDNEVREPQGVYLVNS